MCFHRLNSSYTLNIVFRLSFSVVVLLQTISLRFYIYEFLNMSCLFSLESQTNLYGPFYLLRISVQSVTSYFFRGPSGA